MRWLHASAIASSDRTLPEHCRMSTPLQCAVLVTTLAFPVITHSW